MTASPDSAEPGSRPSDGGDGPVLVLLHGLGTDATTWDRLRPTLSDHFRVLALDLPGYSLASSTPVAPKDVEGLAADLRQELTDQAITQYVLVGHSFGGALAIVMARQDLARCRALVLIAPGGFGPEVNPVLRILGTRQGQTALGLLHQERSQRLLRRMAARLQANKASSARVSELMETYERLASRPARDQLRLSARAALEAKDRIASDATAGISADLPIQILWGANDRVLPPWQAARAQRVFPWCRVDLIAGAGHTPHRSHPAQTAALIEQFLAGIATA